MCKDYIVGGIGSQRVEGGGSQSVDYGEISPYEYALCCAGLREWRRGDGICMRETLSEDIEEGLGGVMAVGEEGEVLSHRGM